MNDGKVVQASQKAPVSSKHGVYGGVAFGLDRFKLSTGIWRQMIAIGKKPENGVSGSYYQYEVSLISWDNY